MSATVTSGEEIPATDEPQFVDLNSVSDAEQLREVIRNPEKFTSEKPVENPKQDQEPDKQTDLPPDPPPETTPPANRVKVVIKHLPDAQKEVLREVSKGASVPEAQAKVVTALVRGGKSLAEAEAEVFGTGGRKAAAAPETEPEPPVTTETTDPVAVKQGEIDALTEKLKSARANYDITAIEELRDQIEQARWDLRDLKDAQKRDASTRQTAAETEFQNRLATATQEAITLFPDANKEGTELFDAIADEVEDLKESNPGFFENPRWPVILAAEKAALLGIPSTKHKGGATPSPGEKGPQPPQKRQSRPLVPASGTSGGSTTNTDPEDPEAALAAAGNDPAKLLEWTRKYGHRDAGAASLFEH